MKNNTLVLLIGLTLYSCFLSTSLALAIEKSCLNSIIQTKPSTALLNFETRKFSQPIGINYSMIKTSLSNDYQFLISPTHIQIQKLSNLAGNYVTQNTLRFEVPMTAIAVKTDGTMLAYGMRDQIRIYDVVNQKIIFKLNNFSSIGSQFLSGLSFLQYPTEIKNSINMMKFTEDGSRLLVGATKKNSSFISIVDANAGKLLRQIIVPHKFPLTRIYPSNDNKMLYFFTESLYKADLHTGAIIEKIDNLENRPRLSFFGADMGESSAHMVISPDSKYLYTRDQSYGDNTFIRKLDLARQENDLLIPIPDNGFTTSQSEFYGFSLDPKGDFILAEISDPQEFHFEIIDTKSGLPVYTLNSKTVPRLRPSDRIQWSADGTTLIILSNSNSEIRYFDFQPFRSQI